MNSCSYKLAQEEEKKNFFFCRRHTHSICNSMRFETLSRVMNFYFFFSKNQPDTCVSVCAFKFSVCARKRIGNNSLLWKMNKLMLICWVEIIFFYCIRRIIKIIMLLFAFLCARTYTYIQSQYQAYKTFALIHSHGPYSHADTDRHLHTHTHLQWRIHTERNASREMVQNTRKLYEYIMLSCSLHSSRLFRSTFATVFSVARQAHYMRLSRSYNISPFFKTEFHFNNFCFFGWKLDEHFS